MKKSLVLIASPLLLLLAGCSESPKPAAEQKKKEPEKAPEPVTGRSAFQQMFITARNWSPDAVGLRVQSIRLDDVKDEPGKSGAWQAVFVSPSRGRARSYTYSVIEGPGNLHKGVFAGPEEGYREGGQAQPFPVAALRVDSNEAYETALNKGKGNEYSKKNPDMPITYLLEKTPRFPNPAWRVIWGESVGTSNFSVYVDASTGNYLQTMR
ncbi:MAG TPA: hypothetical protein VFQ79_10325 [Bryobacteraceae bacterium]|nr:hypothetical protein [Bryobacteraceae bacterium]